jgi:hypothetical protein
MRLQLLALLLSAAGGSLPAADWTEARCDLYPKGSDRLEKMVPCTFRQRQGAVTITLDDGTSYDLSPVGDAPGNYRCRHCRRARSARGRRGWS